MSQPPFKIMIVDDHPAFRLIVRCVAETALDTAIECTECADGTAALAEYGRFHPDLVFMDIEMKPLDGIRATERIIARFPTAQVIMLTQFDDDDMRAAATAAGACGYIPKDDITRLADFIRARASRSATESHQPTRSEPIRSGPTRPDP
jgi:DNA-binding NarL/FixJ family response regulator